MSTLDEVMAGRHLFDRPQMLRDPASGTTCAVCGESRVEVTLQASVFDEPASEAIARLFAEYGFVAYALPLDSCSTKLYVPDKVWRMRLSACADCLHQNFLTRLQVACQESDGILSSQLIKQLQEPAQA